MSITPADIDRLANLARLGLSSQERTEMLPQLNDFFAIVEKMRSVSTDGINPLAHPIEAMSAINLRLREDIVTEFNQREQNQQSAPALDDGLFLVPKVIE